MKISLDFYQNYLLSINYTQKQFLKQLVYYFPLAFIGLLIVTKLASRKVYLHLFAIEDGPVEYATSLIYLVACALAISTAIKLRKSDNKDKYIWLYLFMALGFFVIGMEEISWGQRIFDVQSPEVFQTYNVQQETNLHNFLTRYYLHAVYIIIGFYGAFAHLFLSKKIKTKYQKLVNIIVPSRLLFWYFFPTFLLYTYYDYLSPILMRIFGSQVGWGTNVYGRFMYSRDQEPIEFLLALGFLGVIALNHYWQTRNLSSKKILSPKL